MTTQISNFKIPEYYLNSDVAPSFPMDEGMNALKSSDQQLKLTDRLLENIEKGSVKLEAIRQSISNLESNLSGSNGSVDYNSIFQKVQQEEWVAPGIPVSSAGEYTNPESNQIHIRMWHLGVPNQEEYLRALPQFEGNISDLKGRLETLKTIEKKWTLKDNLTSSAVMGLAVVFGVVGAHYLRQLGS